ncbi:helix-turn-helix transcriptional regulator [Thalassospira lucentensis]|uniref:helix-turn-helix domain-containing protein n=1 Tax=Thalassospira lucentensis TaxID=168935 RepID=UPI002941C225|nr:helix-turn-helix transcriptional regulator [Thalassospira lucentensis]WOI08944.1 helix-turn-helix transcriptional regulator [Thalassospira lucentensis]
MLSLQDIGKEIQAARKFQNMKQAELAKFVGISRTTLSDLERGRISELGYVKISVLLAVLGLDLKIVPANSGRPTLEDLMDDNQGME